jgi:hypothetical protein
MGDSFCHRPANRVQLRKVQEEIDKTLTRITGSGSGTSGQCRSDLNLICELQLTNPRLGFLPTKGLAAFVLS